MASNSLCVIKSWIPEKWLNFCLPMRSLNVISVFVMPKFTYFSFWNFSSSWLMNFLTFTLLIPHHTVWEWVSSYVGLCCLPKLTHNIILGRWSGVQAMPLFLIYLSRAFTGILQRVRIGGINSFRTLWWFTFIYVLVPVGGGKNTLKEGRNPE